MSESVQAIISQLEYIWQSYIIDGMDGLIYVGNATQNISLLIL